MRKKEYIEAFDKGTYAGLLTGLFLGWLITTIIYIIIGVFK